MAKANVELELSNQRCAELEEKERRKVTELKEVMKAMKELKVRCSALETEKVSVEAELDQLQDNTLLCGESFNHVIRQTHLLYKGPPAKGNFDVNKDVFEGRPVAFNKLVALWNLTPMAIVQDIEVKDE